MLNICEVQLQWLTCELYISAYLSVLVCNVIHSTKNEHYLIYLYPQNYHMT